MTSVFGSNFKQNWKFLGPGMLPELAKTASAIFYSRAGMNNCVSAAPARVDRRSEPPDKNTTKGGGGNQKPSWSVHYVKRQGENIKIVFKICLLLDEEGRREEDSYPG